MFRPSDVRRVQAEFDDTLEAPFEAQVQLENKRMTMRVVIMDPDDESLPVGQAVWWFDENIPRNVKQPSLEEVKLIRAQLNRVCIDYPARKAAEAVEKAEREARQAANMAARQADALAQALANAQSAAAVPALEAPEEL